MLRDHAWAHWDLQFTWISKVVDDTRLDDSPFFFLPPASATLALLLRVAFSLGIAINLAVMRVSEHVKRY